MHFDDIQLQWIFEALLTLSEQPAVKRTSMADQHIQPIADMVREELQNRGWTLNGTAVFHVAG